MIRPILPALAQRGAEVLLWQLFFCFGKVGVTSFGGSTQAWIFRAVVEERRWLSETDFLAGVTIAQMLPGANPVNLSLGRRPGRRRPGGRFCGQRGPGCVGDVAAWDPRSRLALLKVQAELASLL